MRITPLAVLTIGVGSLLTLAASEGVGQEPPKAGPEHEVLTRDVGTWDLEVTMSMPQLPTPITSKGKETIESVCGGLFIQSHSTGDFSGIPFEGRSLMGYDSFKKKYTGVWVDNFGSSLYQIEGTYDEKTKTMTLKLSGPDPATGEQFEQKQVVQQIDENTRKSETFMVNPEDASKEPIKILTIIAKRSK